MCSTTAPRRPGGPSKRCICERRVTAFHLSYFMCAWQIAVHEACRAEVTAAVQELEVQCQITGAPGFRLEVGFTGPPSAEQPGCAPRSAFSEWFNGPIYCPSLPGTLTGTLMPMPRLHALLGALPVLVADGVALDGQASTQHRWGWTRPRASPPPCPAASWRRRSICRHSMLSTRFLASPGVGQGWKCHIVCVAALWLSQTYQAVIHLKCTLCAAAWTV